MLLILFLPIILTQCSRKHNSPLTAKIFKKRFVIIKHRFRLGIGKQQQQNCIFDILPLLTHFKRLPVTAERLEDVLIKGMVYVEFDNGIIDNSAFLFPRNYAVRPLQNPIIYIYHTILHLSMSNFQSFVHKTQKSCYLCPLQVMDNREAGFPFHAAGAALWGKRRSCWFQFSGSSPDGGGSPGSWENSS